MLIARAAKVLCALLLLVSAARCEPAAPAPGQAPLQAPERREAAGAPGEEVGKLLAEATALATAGRPAEALPPLREALRGALQAGDTAQAAALHHRLGFTLIALRRPEEAQEHLHASARLRRQNGEDLRAIFDTAMALVLAADGVRLQQVAAGLAELRDELRALRESGGAVRITGLETHAGTFPRPLADILLAGEPEVLPVAGLGGLAITVLEAALLDVEAGLHTDFQRLALARQRLGQLEGKAQAGAGALYLALAALGRCKLDRLEGRLDEALRECTAAVEILGRIDRVLEVTRLALQPFESQVHEELAAVHEVRGEFEQAQVEMELAVAAGGDPCTRAMLITRGAALDLRQGRFERAHSRIRTGRGWMAQSEGCGGLDAQLAAMLAVSEIARGDLGAAQGHAEEALLLAEDAGHRASLTLAWIARLSVDLLLDDEAGVRIARERIRALDPTGAVAAEVLAQGDLLEAIERGDLGAAKAALERLAHRPGGGTVVPQQEVGFSLIDLLLTARSWPDVEARTGPLLALALARGSLLEESQLHALKGVLAHAYDRDEEAIRGLGEALRLYDQGGMDPSLLLGVLGKLHQAAGRTEAAAGHLVRAAVLTDRIARTLRSQPSRIRFFDSGYQGIYRLLVTIRADAGEIDRAFHLAEAARERTLLEALGGSRPLDGTAAAGTLNDRIRQLRESIRRLESPAQPADDQKLRAAREELLTLLRRRQEAAPPAAAGESLPAATLAATRRALQGGETLLSYFFTSDERLLAWVVRPDGAELVELEGARILPADIDCLAGGRRWSTDSREERSFESVSPRRCEAERAAERLHSALLAPLRRHLGAGPLLLVPGGRLHAVPFAALRDPVTHRYLVEDFALGYLPSASVLLALRRREPGSEGEALVVGEPAGADERPIPWARYEAAEVAGFLGTEPLFGTQASEQRVREALARPAVSHVHFATHGSFDRREWSFSRIYLAAAPGSPHDGFLDAYEIAGEMALPDAQLVTLSGCETGLGHRTEGEEVLGLVRAFLIAGSRRVLASRWIIQDQPSADLMIRFYTEIGRGLAPLEALRRAQLALLSDRATAHPVHWAAFMLVGDPAPWAGDRRPVRGER